MKWEGEKWEGEGGSHERGGGGGKGEVGGMRRWRNGRGGQQWEGYR